MKLLFYRNFYLIKNTALLGVYLYCIQLINLRDNVHFMLQYINSCVLVTYCCVTNHPKMYQLKITIIRYYFSVPVVQEFGSDLTRRFWLGVSQEVAEDDGWEQSHLKVSSLTSLTPGLGRIAMPHFKMGYLLLQPSLEITSSHNMVYLFIYSVLVLWALVEFTVSVLWVLHFHVKFILKYFIIVSIENGVFLNFYLLFASIKKGTSI